MAERLSTQARSTARPLGAGALWALHPWAPLSLGVSRQEYWSGLPCPSPGHLPDSGIEPTSPAMQADSLSLSHQGNPWFWRARLKTPSLVGSLHGMLSSESNRGLPLLPSLPSLGHRPLYTHARQAHWAAQPAGETKLRSLS